MKLIFSFNYMYSVEKFLKTDFLKKKLKWLKLIKVKWGNSDNIEY
jgi:hypothetical protein